MRPRAVPMLLSIALLAGCTADDPPTPGPSVSGPPSRTTPTAKVTFVGTLSGTPNDSQYLDAVRLAVVEVNGGSLPVRIDLEVLDDGGDPEGAAESVLAATRTSAAVLYAGPGTVLTTIRPELEPTRVPVLLLDGDLYTVRGLYSNVFQVSVPLLWQARVLARYLRVRGEDQATFVNGNEEPEAESLAWTSAAREEGIGDTPPEPALPSDVPAVVLNFPGGGGGSQTLSDDDLLGAQGLPRPPRPGTVAVSAYAWSGWAEPLPRVRAFREAFRGLYGRLPMGQEQHGYDALQVLAIALADTGAGGGARLLARLEQVKHRFFSSMPVRLGPDDHTFYDDWTLGVFAVAGPNDEVEPWMEGQIPWRPVMRSWSYGNEERVVLWERDLRAFFPRWRDPAPSPKYRYSRLGIVTPASDPLH